MRGDRLVAPVHSHCVDDGDDDDELLHGVVGVRGSDALLIPTLLLLDHSLLPISQAGYQVRSLLLCGFHSCHFVPTSRNRSAGYQTMRHSRSHTVHALPYYSCL